MLLRMQQDFGEERGAVLVILLPEGVRETKQFICYSMQAADRLPDPDANDTDTDQLNGPFCFYFNYDIVTTTWTLVILLPVCTACRST